ncbi:sensor domain-containing diguanylate cyclase [Rheinheimera baltica]|uniref:sensor domain-containing diguanylate cyclase n=1 Tax=Rheinheimera baltica TaxID=67576 RepID=UPI00273E248A|nr:sensor domain-containing diguanylate cyclase [Rheinheimera baltica]MDP5150520.1 diguanylate cyclase [Rheinheimera baltica]
MPFEPYTTRPRQSLVKKLTRLNQFVLSGAMVLSFLLIASVLWLMARERQAAAAELAGIQLANNIGAMLVFNDVAAAEHEINLLTSQRDMSQLVVWNQQGEEFVRARHMPNAAAHTAKDVYQPTTTLQRSYDLLQIQLYIPVVVHDKFEGVIFYQERLQQLLGWFLQGLAVLSVVMSAVFLLASRLLIRIQKHALHPLVELADVAEQVALQRDYGLRAKLYADDEIGRLTLRFNELLKRTQIWQSELNDKLSQEQQHGEALKELAQRDSLTGLANRHYFEQLIQQMVQHSVQTNSLSALVFIDLDNFKFVNDNFGHDAGDAVLIEIARRISGVIRSNDSLCRLGGDEFALLVPELNKVADVTQLCRRILQESQQPLLVQGHVMPVGLSIGIACCPLDASNAALLLQYADSAMYQAKRAGKNDFKFYSNA